MKLAAVARLIGGCGIALMGSAGCSDQGPKESSSSAPPTNRVDSAGTLRAAIPLIVDPIDETQRTLLPGNTRGEVRPALDRGPVDDSLPLNGIQLLLLPSSLRRTCALCSSAAGCSWDAEVRGDRAMRRRFGQSRVTAGSS